MSEEDLDLLVTLDDPGEENGGAADYLQMGDSVIGDGSYPVVFSEGDWTCAVSRLAVTTNDTSHLLNVGIDRPPDQRFEIDVCLVTCTKKGKIVEQKVFYDLVGMQKQLESRRHS